MFRQFERDFSYQTYGEDQESIRGLEVELEWENAENFGVVADGASLRAGTFGSIQAPIFLGKTEGTEISVGRMGAGLRVYSKGASRL